MSQSRLDFAKLTPCLPKITLCTVILVQSWKSSMYTVLQHRIKNTVWGFQPEICGLVGVLTNDCHLPNEPSPSPGQPCSLLSTISIWQNIRISKFIICISVRLNIRIFQVNNLVFKAEAVFRLLAAVFRAFLCTFTQMRAHLGDVLKRLQGRYKRHVATSQPGICRFRG